MYKIKNILNYLLILNYKNKERNAISYYCKYFFTMQPFFKKKLSRLRFLRLLYENKHHNI